MGQSPTPRQTRPPRHRSPFRDSQKTCLALHPGLLARYGHLHLLSSHLAKTIGITCQANDLALSFSTDADATKLREQLKTLTTNHIEDSATFDTQAIEALKFHECLPPPLQQSVLKARSVNRDLLNGILSTHTTPVYVSEEE